MEWDDLGDSQQHVDNQGKPTPCANHHRDTSWEEEEEELNKRMDIIGSNGNEGLHYPEYKDYINETDEESIPN
jgi:hypothetical protein